MAHFHRPRKQSDFQPIAGLNAAERSIISRIHYPRLSITILIFLIFYFLIYGKFQVEMHSFLLALGYVGIFIAGVLYSYGFTAGPAALILLSLAKNENIFLATLVGAVGCMMGDLIIFFFIRREFGDEIDEIAKTNFMQHVINGEKRLFGHFQKYVLPVFASFCIASPLPTEIGVALMASRKTLSTKKFMIIDFSLDAAGIFMILLLGWAT